MNTSDGMTGFRHYAFVLVPGFAMMSYASASEPLRAANVVAGKELYSWCHLSLDGRAVQASSGASISVDASFEEAGDPDAVLVCAGGNPAAFEDAPTIAWLRAVARRRAAVGGISGGPFILAKAGLLDGYRATVHWEHAAAFREAFPAVALQKTLFEIDRRRLTSAGGVAALDLMHRIIGEDHGYDLARAVSDWFLQAHVRPGGGAQRSSLRERLGVRNARLETVLSAMEERVESPASRTALAALAGVSVRQLERLFAAHLGTSLDRFYLDRRLERAMELLKQTSLSVTEISLAAGFASASHFSRTFRKRFGASPRAMR